MPDTLKVFYNGSYIYDVTHYTQPFLNHNVLP